MNASTADDWRWKLETALEAIRTRYEHIGSKTGAPFLAIIYPPGAECEVLKIWHALVQQLKPDFSVTTIDVLQLTSRVVQQVGADTLVASMEDPMPGSDPGLWRAFVEPLFDVRFESVPDAKFCADCGAALGALMATAPAKQSNASRIRIREIPASENLEGEQARLSCETIPKVRSWLRALSGINGSNNPASR